MALIIVIDCAIINLCSKNRYDATCYYILIVSSLTRFLNRIMNSLFSSHIPVTKASRRCFHPCIVPLKGKALPVPQHSCSESTRLLIDSRTLGHLNGQFHALTAFIRERNSWCPQTGDWFLVLFYYCTVLWQCWCIVEFDGTGWLS